MRKTISLLLALALSAFFAAGSLADEFFSEESFVTGAGAGEESFFEEGFFGGDFFAEDDFSGAPAEEPEGEPAEDGAQERTVLATTYVDNEGQYSYSDVFWDFVNSKPTPAGEPITLLDPSVIDAKPNEVKLEWQHFYYDGYAKKSVKLPKGVMYYVYEMDDYNSGLFYQVAKTAKQTVTLKNQNGGLHRYFVRAEYVNKGEEAYGPRSKTKSIIIEDVGMWKTFSQVSLIQRKAGFAYTTQVDPILRIRTKEQPEALRLEVTVRYASGASFPFIRKTAPISFLWSQVAVGSGYEYEIELNLNDTYFTTFASGDILLNTGTDYAKSVTVKVTPAALNPKTGTYIDGKTTTVKLNKIYYPTDTKKAAPVIHWVRQHGEEFQMSVSFSEKDYLVYGIWDGNEYCGNYYNFGSLDVTITKQLAKKAKAGAHKITIAEMTWVGPKATAVGDKATITLNVPAPAKAPVTVSNLEYDSTAKKITGTIWNSNPKAYGFSVEIQNSHGVYLQTEYEYADPNGKAANGIGYDSYPFNSGFGWSVSDSYAPFNLIITTFCLDKNFHIVQRVVSDVYVTDGEVIPVKR